MKKKLQIFISSTYTDLQEERQAAVEAILNAGHIPAGMELFSASNDSQLDTVKRWIEESDIYLLILGGRYGSLEPKSQYSYTQIEYEFALERGIPLFAVVISDDALQANVKMHGTQVIELENRDKYDEFKRSVISRVCRFFNDTKDIKLAIHETLADFQRRYQFSGWVSGKKVMDFTGLVEENRKLLKENSALNTKLAKLSNEKKALLDSADYNEIKNALTKTDIKIPADLAKVTEKANVDLLTLFIANKDRLAIGVTNRAGTDNHETFLFYKVASKLITFGLVEKVKVTGKVLWDKLQTSKVGHEFIKKFLMQEKRKKCKSS